MISIICALAENNAIGYNNDLIYHLRADLKRFKALTTGHTVIMGRRTFESLPKGALPNRRNIVISAHTTQAWDNTEVYPSLEKALDSCTPEEDVYIIGGASIYKAALDIADRLCLTRIHATPMQADVFFPEFDEEHWTCVAKEDHESDEQNEQPFSFEDYIRK